MSDIKIIHSGSGYPVEGEIVANRDAPADAEWRIHPWRGIESAPRDGTRILVCGRGIRPTVGRYYDRQEMSFGHLVSSRSGWIYEDSRVAELRAVASLRDHAEPDPTFWMEIPPVPGDF